MVVNREALGMTTGEVVNDEDFIDGENGILERRGRGRPAGSLNKSNGLSKLKVEVSSLNAKVEALEAQIRRIEQTPPVQLNVPASSNQLERRVSVIQTWVENFHTFLLSGRITNSVEKAAEDELALIIRRMPDNSSIDNAER